MENERQKEQDGGDGSTLGTSRPIGSNLTPRRMSKQKSNITEEHFSKHTKVTSTYASRMNTGMMTPADEM